MHEVEVRAVRNSVEERERAVVLDAVPSHVRNLATGWEAAHDTWNHVEPASLAELLARRKEELVPEADAEERPRAVERAAQGLDETARCEVRHRIVERAVAGQHDRVGVVDGARIFGHDGRNADALERLLHAAEIAAAVVDDRDHGAPTALPSSTAGARRCAG